MKVWIPHQEGTALMGALPSGLTVEIYPGRDRLPSDPSDVEFWVPPFLSGAEAAAGLALMPGLRVVQLLTAGADVWTGRVGSGVILCDARGVHSSSTSEWVLTVTLAFVRSIPRFVLAKAEGRWDYALTDELGGKRILVIGAGAIGEATCDRLAPFGVELTRVALHPRPGVFGTDELPRLLPAADVVILLVPLTEATRGLVDSKFLASMGDGALLVNASRGPVVNTEALVAELSSGRLSAALDVVDPEPLPAGHPLWTLPNVLLTPHVAGSVRGFPKRAYALVGAQLRRFVEGRALDNVVVDGY
ncbi:MAG: 2-hydroxyacid dehydrogenase [Acidimicrobiia bacterium]